MWSDTYRHVLHGLKDRQTMFSADGHGEASLHDFQGMRAALRFFEEVGVVRNCKEHFESETGRDYVDLIGFEIVADPSSDDFPSSGWQRIVLRRFYVDRNDDIVQPNSVDFADLLTQEALDKICSHLAEKRFLNWVPVLSGGGAGTITAKGIEEIEETKEGTMAQHISMGDVIAGNFQVGNQNTLNATTVVANIEALIQAIDRRHRKWRNRRQSQGSKRFWLIH